MRGFEADRVAATAAVVGASLRPEGSPLGGGSRTHHVLPYAFRKRGIQDAARDFRDERRLAGQTGADRLLRQAIERDFEIA